MAANETTTGDGSERRQFPRVNVLLKLQYSHPSGFLADYLTDLSSGGVFIRTDVDFTVGEGIAFSLSFPSLLDPLPCEGIVRWKRPGDPDGDMKGGVGVEFVFKDDEQRRQIAALVDLLLSDIGAQSQLPLTLRVLLAEDNVLFHDLFKYAFARLQSEIKHVGTVDLTIAADGKRACDLLKRTPPFDLAVIDFFLPLVEGPEIIRAIRASDANRAMPVLAISVGKEDERERAMAAGADLFLPKPLHLKELLATIRLMLIKQVRNSLMP
jgi:uncharacterized protein (TIGR02266 family)